MIRLHSAILIALAAIAAPASAQVSLQGAHDQGINLGKEQNNSVGTSRINEQTAAQVPFYRPNAVQSGGFDGGFGDMISIGVSRINQSKTYSSGSCDREGFNPEQAAQSVMGPAKWAALTPAQKQQAISDQVRFFDQECEGINFLAGAKKDQTTLHYNGKITIKDIPLEAYDYVVNGKPALDWVVERQCVKTDKTSGIVNDANDWAIETMGNPKYPLELFLRVITVSLETMKIVRSLPALDIMDT